MFFDVTGSSLDSLLIYQLRLNNFPLENPVTNSFSNVNLQVCSHKRYSGRICRIQQIDTFWKWKYMLCLAGTKETRCQDSKSDDRYL